MQLHLLPLVDGSLIVARVGDQEGVHRHRVQHRQNRVGENGLENSFKNALVVRLFTLVDGLRVGDLNRVQHWQNRVRENGLENV